MRLLCSRRWSRPSARGRNTSSNSRGKSVRLEGKIAVVTGASGGIGRAIADLFVAEGAFVYASDVVVRASSERLTYVSHDVSEEATWTQLSDRIRREHGRLDILVNNAGIVGTYGSI